LCESQDGLGASVTVLVIPNFVITVAGNGMCGVEGILIPLLPSPPPRWFVQFCGCECAMS